MQPAMRQGGVVCRRGSGYSRDYDAADKGRGGGGFDGHGSRGYDQREDKRGFGSNFDQDERRGSFRDRPKGDYGRPYAVLTVSA